MDPALKFASTCALLFVVGTSCRGVRPAKADFVERLERPVSEEARAELDRAERELAGGQWREALLRLETLCTENPACARVAILARRAVSLAPESERDRLTGLVFAKIQEERARTTDDLELASLSFGEALFTPNARDEEVLLRKAVQREPNHYYALAKLGEMLWRRGELEAARTVLERAVSLRRDLAEGWLMLAQVSEDRGLYTQAGRHYETYLGLRPLDRRVQLEYARLLVTLLRDGERAEQILEPLRKVDPGNLEVGLNLGLALFLQERHADAEVLYLAMLERWPREPRVLLSLGNLYHGALKAPKRALQAYRWLVAQRASADVLAMLGQSLFVPARIRQIEGELRARGVAIPAPPSSVQDLFRLAAERAKSKS